MRSPPDRFYARVIPTKVRAPRIVKLNRALADLLGADADRIGSAEGTEVLAGNAVPLGAEPIALAYAGHQFGAFVPRLGGGRAILLGEVVGKGAYVIRARFGRQRDGWRRARLQRGADGCNAGPARR